jgi:primosomal protein N' (replication factor Y) (superfamily II helicase)
VLIRVGVPVPGLGLLTYRVPEPAAAPVVGARVVVPLGSRTVTAIIVETEVSPEGIEESAIKPIRQLLDADAFIPPDVVELARWTADYYAAGAGEAITAVLPPKTRGERADAHKTRRVAAITAAGSELAGPPRDGNSAVDAAIKLTVRQQEALDILAGVPDGLATAQLAARGISGDVIARLTRHGFVVVRQERVNRDPFQAGAFVPGAVDAARRLTLEQESAVSRLTVMADANVFRVALLHGVTGSGKTEIYVRMAAAVRAAGRRVLMLVPEIALTPALAALCRQAFGDRVAIQHSGMSDGERHDQWQRIRRGDIDVVVGTRSAVFVPVQQLGLVIVDEEHDGSYKQEESPRYNGRDVAIVRAQRAGALVILGSATPSMETYHHAVTGKYERIVLERRVLDRPLAALTCARSTPPKGRTWC